MYDFYTDFNKYFLIKLILFRKNYFQFLHKTNIETKYDKDVKVTFYRQIINDKIKHKNKKIKTMLSLA